MIIKNFKLKVVVRVVLICMLSLLLAYVLTNTEWFFTPLVVSILLIVVVINLIYLVEKTNKDLSYFLMTIKQRGFTSMFKGDKQEGTQAELSNVFNEVLREFQKISIEKESHYQYLQTLNENIGVAIISYDDDGNIQLMNPAAKVLLKKPYLKNFRDIEPIDENLYKAIINLESGGTEVIKTFLADEMKQLSLQVKDFVLQGKHFRLVLLQNIHSELEQKEVEAWQKLISVLTHEIMNSVTPIASLSTAVNQIIQNKKIESLTEEDIEDVITSIQTIENRSKSLMKFVNAYKDFSKTPELHPSEFDLITMVDRIHNLLKPDIDNAGLKLIHDHKVSELKVKADFELIEQVLINLIKNAIEALSEKRNGEIRVILRKEGASKTRIIVSDNGPGINKEILDRIFIPFFTTKRKGTGVGLSFAKQIMKLHKGTISVQSSYDLGTTFMLEF